MKNIVCFGEVLWDVFPNHKKIGGAPLNVALRLQSLDNNVSIITRIGDDDLGMEIKKFIKERDISLKEILIYKRFGRNYLLSLPFKKIIYYLLCFLGLETLVRKIL